MTYNEHLLVVANEECTEIAQEVDKALRFGLNNYHPSEPSITNEHRILKEYYQLQAVMEMLFDQQILHNLPYHKIDEIKSKKRAAVADYMDVAIKCGTVTSDDPHVPGTLRV